jgi:hypothetical protein
MAQTPQDNRPTRVSEEELMAIRNCAFGVGACIILTMAAPRTYGEMVPPQIVQLTDQAGVICKTVVDYYYRSRTADPHYRGELETPEQLDGRVRAQFGELFERMLKKAEWPAINLSRDDYERLIWWALFEGPPHGWEGCHGQLSQLMVDFIVGRRSPAPERLQRQNIYPFHPR